MGLRVSFEGVLMVIFTSPKMVNFTIDPLQLNS